MNDATQSIRSAATALPGVVVGQACTQTAFKVGTKAFLYIGQQGGRYKAMFRLQQSLSEAEALAAKRPDDFQLGLYVTARFSEDSPLPEDLWKRWLNESYAIACGGRTGASRKRVR